jgi:hypothetical protein
MDHCFLTHPYMVHVPVILINGREWYLGLGIKGYKGIKSLARRKYR